MSKRSVHEKAQDSKKHHGDFAREIFSYHGTPRCVSGVVRQQAFFSANWDSFVGSCFRPLLKMQFSKI